MTNQLYTFSFISICIHLFQSLDNAILPILNKPKPKTEQPKEEKSKEKSSDNHKTNQNTQGDCGAPNDQRQSSEDNMDVE